MRTYWQTSKKDVKIREFGVKVFRSLAGNNQFLKLHDKLNNVSNDLHFEISIKQIAIQTQMQTNLTLYQESLKDLELLKKIIKII